MTSTSLVFLQKLSSSGSRASQTSFSSLPTISTQLVQVKDLPSDFEGYIPLTVSVSVPQEYSAYLVPVLVENRSPSLLNDSPGPSNSNARRLPPFLPLPADFEPSIKNHWENLMKPIENWLIRLWKRDRIGTEDWVWGLDAFWMAFTAVYSDFPSGDWQPWNPVIPISGRFVEDWLAYRSRDTETSEVGPCQPDPQVLDDIWHRFQRHLQSYIRGD